MKMKKTKILGLILALIMFFTNLPFGSGIVHAEGEDVLINDDNFPDELFQAYVRKFDQNKDGSLSKAERVKVKIINVERTNRNETAYDYLNGIEFFPNLQELNYANNKVKSIDLSNNKELTVINCSKNGINSLDLTKNTKLIGLNCSENDIEKLNLENNTLLEKIDCSKNSINNLDLSNNKELINLVCEGSSIKKLNLRSNTKLKTLDCSWNSLQDLDLSNNLDLIELDCHANNLPTLNLASNKKLNKLCCKDSKINELTLADNNDITELDCENNNLDSLDLSKSENLVYLKCCRNKITSLDLSNNTKLTNLDCWSNHLTSLDLSKNNISDFSGSTQKYIITLIKGAKTIKASDLPAGFDLSKVISGSVENAKLTSEGFELEPKAEQVNYNYRVNNNERHKLECTLIIKHYTKLIIKNNPKLEYTEGDELDLSDLEVTLTDGEGNSIDVPYEKFPVYKIKTDLENKEELKKNYNGHKIQVSVEKLIVETNELVVNDREFNPDKIEKIEVKTQPVKLKYIEGDELELTGLVVTLIDDYKKVKDVQLENFEKNGLTTIPEIKTKLKITDNTKPIIIKKGNLKTYTNQLTVTEKSFNPNNVKSMTIKEQPIKLEYTEGQNLDLTGLEVTLTDDFGKIKDVKFEKFGDYGINAEPANATKLTVAGHNGKPVTLTKGSLEPAKTENLTVKAKVFDPEHIESIAVTTQPKKLTYTEEEALDLDGLVVTLTDNQGTTKEVAFADFDENGLIATPANETELTVADNGKTVTITKGNLSAETAALTVNSKGFDLDNLKTIEVISQPSNLIYTEGEKLNLAGLKVKLTDDKGKIKEVSFEAFEENGIKTDPANDADLKVADNGKTVTITKGNARTETYALTVNPKVFDSQNIAKIEVKTQPKLDYTEGNKLDLSKLEVTLTDNQGLTKDVTFDNFDDYGLTATPTNDTALTVDDHDGKNVTITKGNASAETKALTVKAKENPPAPTDPKIIGPVDPNAPGATIPSPNKYWTVTFVSEDTNKGTVDAANTFYIPMTESKKLSDLKAPAVTAKSGFEFEKWDLPKDTAIDNNLTVKAIFKAQGTVNPPVEPSIPSDNIIGPVDSESNLYKELDKHKDEYYKLIFDDNDYTRIYVLFVKKGQGIRLTDIAAYAPNVVADEGYVFTGWSPMLYGNTELIENDRYIVAEFEEIGRPYRPYWPDYREERPYRPYRPYRHYEDDRDTEPVVEEKPVEVNEYDKLEAILFINDTMMQKSVNGVVSQVRMDIAPFIYQARTMLPIRYVAESLGFMVTWDANTRTVYLVDKENIVQIPVDTNNIIVNGKAFVSDVKPMIKNNRTMLPVANVARALGLQDGKDILWDAAMKFVTLRRNVLK